jgi:glyoxylase-like metal-dependent hydrolase (beta-lactamase superfamily II)
VTPGETRIARIIVEGRVRNESGCRRAGDPRSRRFGLSPVILFHPTDQERMFMPKSTFKTLAGLGLSACAFAGAAQAASLQEAATLLSATSIKTLEFSGSGHWLQFGQAPVPGGDWPKFDVSAYSASIDFDKKGERVLITRSQTPDGRARPAPTEQKLEWSVLGDKAWNVAPPQGAAPGAALVATSAPAALEERVADIWSTPQGFLKAALANGAKSEAKGAGVEVSFTAGNHQYVGTIGADNHVASIRTWIDSPVLGDTLLETSFSDYKDFGGLHFPTQIHRSAGGHEVLHVAVSAAKANGPADIAIPAALAPPPVVTVASEKLADGVYYLTGGTHHSVAVEEKDHVVLIEAPLNEERSLALIQKIGELVPGKPIKYVVNSHVHFDHSGGLRTFVDADATIVTQGISKAFYEKVWSLPHTLRPDRLAASKKPPKFEAYEHKHVLGEGDHRIEVHHIAASGHSDDLALVYLPKEKLIVEADAYTPAAPGAPAPKTPNPFSVNLYENIQKLGLDVERIAGLHGRVASLDELRTAIGRQTAAQ